MYTWAESILSRWYWQIFPRAETALSYAITFSCCKALGCWITAFNLDRASAKIHEQNVILIINIFSNCIIESRSSTSNQRFKHRSSKLCTNTKAIHSSLQKEGHNPEITLQTIDAIKSSIRNMNQQSIYWPVWHQDCHHYKPPTGMEDMFRNTWSNGI